MSMKLNPVILSATAISILAVGSALAGETITIGAPGPTSPRTHFCRSPTAAP